MSYVFRHVASRQLPVASDSYKFDSARTRQLCMKPVTAQGLVGAHNTFSVFSESLSRVLVGTTRKNKVWFQFQAHGNAGRQEVGRWLNNRA